MKNSSVTLKSIYYIVLTLLFFLVTSQIASAATTPDGFEYSIKGNNATITGYTGTGGNIAIPATINDSVETYKVTSVGEWALAWRGSIISVSIPDSVTNIGDDVFYYCTGLTTIDVSDGNKNYSSIDGVLFNKSQDTLICCPAGRVGLFDIPNSVSNIGKDAFSYCSNLTSITIPDSVKIINDGAFSLCPLTSVSIPDSVRSMGGWAFFGCEDMMNVEIGDSVRSIEAAAFAECPNLTDLDIGDNVRSIGSNAFQDCSSLISVTIPDRVTSIGEWSFNGCHSLTSVTIGERVTSIGDAAFQECTSLTNVEIPANVTSIDLAAFAYCTSLTEAKFFGNAPTMGDSVFDNCDPGFKVYYLDGKRGFTTPYWNGYPAEPF